MNKLYVSTNLYTEKNKEFVKDMVPECVLIECKFAVDDEWVLFKDIG